jgi:DNA-binding GntR family transcriptional regulator
MSAAATDSAPALQPIYARVSLRDETLSTLHAAIISGELRPGVIYSVPLIAAQVGVSATPVREAMLDLVKEGLVEPVRNKGFRVTELSETDLDELTELRRLIEVPTVRRIAKAGASADALRELKALAAEIEKAAKRNDLVAHNVADLAFHRRLLELSGNRNLVEVVHTLRIRSRLYGMATLADRGQLLPTSHEHSELIECIAAREPAKAEQLMHHHIGHVRGAWARGTADS